MDEFFDSSFPKPDAVADCLAFSCYALFGFYFVLELYFYYFSVFAKARLGLSNKRQQSPLKDSPIIGAIVFGLLLFFSFGVIFVHIDDPYQITFDEHHYVIETVNLLNFGDNKNIYPIAEKMIEKSSMQAKRALELQSGFTEETPLERKLKELDEGVEFFLQERPNGTCGWHYTDLNFGYNVFESVKVSHPPLGKIIIAAGILAAGGNVSSFTWRIGVGVFGIIHVLAISYAAFILVKVIAREPLAGILTAHLPAYSHYVAAFVGGALVLTDGLHVAAARCALLDGPLAALAAAAVAALLKDYEMETKNLENGRQYFHWWRLLCGVFCGLATSCKLSAIFSVIGIGICSILLELSASLQTKRSKKPLTHCAFIGMIVSVSAKAFLQLFLPFAISYLATWTIWFTAPTAYLRDENGPTVLGKIKGLIQYHKEFFEYHANLMASHRENANPLYFLIQKEKTVFTRTNEAPTEAYPSLRRLFPLELRTVSPRNDNSGIRFVISQGNFMNWWIGDASIIFVHQDTFLLLLGPIITLITYVCYIVLSFGRNHVFNFYCVQFLPSIVLGTITFFTIFTAYIRLAASKAQKKSIARILIYGWNAVILIFLLMTLAIFAVKYPLWSGQCLFPDDIKWRLFLTDGVNLNG